MAGGGTAGHVMPLLAVAEQLRDRGHFPYFIGTQNGFEAKLVPQRNFPIEYIDIAGFQGMRLMQKARLVYQLPISIGRCLASISKNKPIACFSLGGYAAAPPVLASRLRNLPLVLMEPNAMPGLVNRWMGRSAHKALLSFPQAASYFPQESVEITGLPVREEFFAIEPKPLEAQLTVLITGGSQGSQTLNRALREAWPFIQQSGLQIKLIHQCGKREEESLRRDFALTGITGSVSAFIDDMPAAFAAADFVVSRAGAGTVSELAAAGRAALLVPFPFAADDHQAKNAQAVVEAGAGLMLRDAELTGPKLFEILNHLISSPSTLISMTVKSREMRKPGAAARAADILEEIAARNS